MNLLKCVIQSILISLLLLNTSNASESCIKITDDLIRDQSFGAYGPLGGPYGLTVTTATLPLATGTTAYFELNEMRLKKVYKIFFQAELNEGPELNEFVDNIVDKTASSTEIEVVSEIIRGLVCNSNIHYESVSELEAAVKRYLK